MVYLVLIHIISAILFIGNIITAAFWKLKAEFSGDETHINKTAKNIMIADYVFTLPSIITLLISGFILAKKSNYPLDEINWLTISLTLFAITGLIWVIFLLPLQRKMIKYSEEKFSKSDYKKASRTWDIIGTISTIIPIIILYLMVAKPF